MWNIIPKKAPHADAEQKVEISALMRAYLDDNEAAVQLAEQNQQKLTKEQILHLYHVMSDAQISNAVNKENKYIKLFPKVQDLINNLENSARVVLPANKLPLLEKFYGSDKVKVLHSPIRMAALKKNLAENDYKKQSYSDPNTLKTWMQKNVAVDDDAELAVCDIQSSVLLNQVFLLANGQGNFLAFNETAFTHTPEALAKMVLFAVNSAAEENDFDKVIKILEKLKNKKALATILDTTITYQSHRTHMRVEFENACKRFGNATAKIIGAFRAIFEGLPFKIQMQEFFAALQTQIDSSEQKHTESVKENALDKIKNLLNALAESEHADEILANNTFQQKFLALNQQLRPWIVGCINTIQEKQKIKEAQQVDKKDPAATQAAKQGILTQMKTLEGLIARATAIKQTLESILETIKQIQALEEIEAANQRTQFILDNAETLLRVAPDTPHHFFERPSHRYTRNDKSNGNSNALDTGVARAMRPRGWRTGTNS